MKKLKNGVILFLSALLIAGAITGCGSTGAANSATSQKTENSAPASQTPSEQGQKTVLKVAYRQSDNPMTFQDENGNPSGALGEIFAIAAEYLDGYEIEYIPTSNDGLNLGVAAGDYDVGLFNAAYTKDRAETYVFPTEYFGASKMVAIVRKEHADLDTIEKIAQAGLTVAPVSPNNGITFALEQWNENNPDQQLKLTYRDDSAADTGIEDVASGKYDVNFTLAAFWNGKVVAEDGVYHSHLDELTANFVLAMKTYPIISPATVGANEAFVKALSDALLAARNDPRTVEISERYYGDNFLEYPYGEGW